MTFKPPWEPSEQEIERACFAIRMSWTEEQFRQRYIGPHKPTDWLPPGAERFGDYVPRGSVLDNE